MDEKALHDDATLDAYAHLWDDPSSMETTLDAAIAALRAAHAGTGRCCTLCPVCRRLNAIFTSLLTATMRSHHKLHPQYEALYPQYKELRQQYLVVQEQYGALRDAHEALMLEHEDLQAAYFVAQQALQRASVKDSEQA